MTEAPIVYLAGPMRGIPFYNATTFDRTAAVLRSRGYRVVNPCDLDRTDYGIDFSLYPTGTEVIPDMPPLPEVLLRDLEYLAAAEAIILLPGYDRSSGALTELAFANFCGHRVLHWSPEDAALWSVPGACNHPPVQEF